MQLHPTKIPEVIEIVPSVFSDDRGSFLEQYNQEVYTTAGILPSFVQDNLSVSKKGVLRGLHFQSEPYAQDKLVTVIFGTVFDVAVDLRPDSSTYKQWVSVILDHNTHNQLFIPKGFAHGFYVMSSEARFFYKCSAPYNKEASSGIRWDDPTLAIQWPLEGDPILSSQDLALPFLQN
ncbi:dTDP-4-dehydrorhamnose 3,5-epimerase [Candidatus Woesebacteria bacterium]|nr:dTDP-4-dehydrorhamnose 3,5-epimerase [Candidatus Woesebacteria bacterium]